jgi:hypothetical protein
VAGVVPFPGYLVTFEPQRLAQYGLIQTTTNSDGQFRITGAVPGEFYELTPTTQTLPDGRYFAGMTQGARDLSAGALPVVTGGEPVRILLKNDGARVDGRVRDGGKIPARAFVVLAPKDRSVEYWFRSAFTSPVDGTFRLNGVPPGDYDLFAFDRNDEDVYYDDAFLREYMSRSTPVSVQPRVVRIVDLELMTIDRN